MRELAKVLLPGENVRQCMNGQYDGGFALLAATDMRVLLIDKKPMYLTLEDIRFDMISEVDYNHNLFNATLHIFTPNQTIRFVVFNQVKMRKFFNLIQNKVMEIRQHYLMLENPSMPVQPITAQPMEPITSVGGVNQNQETIPEVKTEATNPAQISHLQIGMGGMRRIAPVISAYTRLPMRTQQRHFLGLSSYTPKPLV
jgi:hypothetical protein